MRFTSNGPAIPESLINARNAGNVVLLCGAGVSIPIMPGFEQLTDDVITDLGAAKAKAKREEKLPLDMVFKEIIKECGPAHVADAIYRRLRVKGRPNVDRHAALIDLATTPDRRVQLVTTNFDHLFERANPDLARHIAPLLPDLTLDDPLHGLVYLHGRLQKPVVGSASKLVLSSNEFGRAYLAQGWATRFLRDLSRRHSILMIGYSANDPPVNYLLEGFSENDGRQPIYTFLSDDRAGDIDAWRDRGVITMPYDRVDKAHSGLWETLLAWASASRDPGAWQAQLVATAQQQPITLQPYQRGQVAHLVRSYAGTMAFCQATPPPPAEWLCVFDPSVRFGRPGTASFVENAPVDDPLDAYGLDDDAPRDPERRDGDQVREADNLLGWQDGDGDIRGVQRLSGWTEQFTSALVPRHYRLADWIATVMDQPAALWWASRSTGLHPGLIDALQRRIGHGLALDPSCRLAWQHVIRARRGTDDNEIHRDWYELQRDTERDGWTPAVLRTLSEVLQPRWTVINSWMGGPLPPSTSESTEWARLAPVEPQIGGYGLALPDPPDEHVAELVDIAGSALHQFASMMAECDRRFWHVPTLHPTGERGEVLDGDSLFVIFWFKDLFIRLVALDPARARRRFEDWRGDEPYLFAKFTMLGISLAKFIPATQAGTRLLAIPDDILWDGYNRRDLLIALKNRWSEFDAATQQRIERRIIKGPPRWRKEPLKDYRHRRTGEAASVLKWLVLNGRKLSPAAQKQLSELIKVTPGWRDSWAAMADDSMGPRGGAIEQDLDTQGLERAQLGDIVRLADALSTEEFRELKQYRPFRGLVAQSPLKALSALRRSRREGLFPEKYWKDLISEWPDTGHGRRLDWLLAKTVAALSPEETFALRYYVPSWLDKHIGGLSESDFSGALSVFGNVVSSLSGYGPDAFTSGVGETRVGNVVQKESRLSMTKAINAPGGRLAQALLNLLGQPTERGALPVWFTENADRLMALSGDGGGHAVCVLCSRYSFLEYWGQSWTRRKLLTKFSLDNPLSEAAWHGLPYGRGASRSAWLKLKPHFANLIVGNVSWTLGREAHRSLLGWFARSCLPSQNSRKLFSAREAKETLANCDVSSLVSILGHWRGALVDDQSWNRGVGPLIRTAWPKQSSKRTDATINAMISLASAAGDAFPEAVRDIRLHLAPVQKLEIWDLTDRRQKNDVPGLGSRYPKHCLEIIEAVAKPGFTNLPYDFKDFVRSLGSDPDLQLRTQKLLNLFSI